MRCFGLSSLPDDLLAKIFWESDNTASRLEGDVLWSSSHREHTLYHSTTDVVDPGSENPDPQTPSPPPSANLSHILTIASVCRRWRYISRQSVTRLHVLQDRMVFRPDLERVVKSFPRISDLHLSDGSVESVDDSLLSLIASSLPNLTSLYVGRRIPSVKISEAGLDNFLRRCCRLEQLSLHCLPSNITLPSSDFQLIRLRTFFLNAKSALDNNNFPDLAMVNHLSIGPRDVELHQLTPLSCFQDLTSLFFPAEKWDSESAGGFDFAQLESLRLLAIRGVVTFSLMFPAESPCASLERLLLGELAEMLPEGLQERFPRLRELSLCGCHSLVDLPESFTDLTSLEMLTFSRCHNLSALPDRLGNLQRLRSLVLHQLLSITELPDSLALLTNLQELVLVECLTLESLPSTISSLTSLTSLTLEDLKLRELPEIGTLIHLQTLILKKCEISQPFPPSFCQLSSLTRLEIYSSGIVRLPEAIGELGALQELSLRHTALAELPESITQLTRLEILQVHRSHITSAPRSLSCLSRLRHLELTESLLEDGPDSLPSSLETLRLGNRTYVTGVPDISPNIKQLCLIRVIVTNRPPATGCIFSQLKSLEVQLCPDEEALPIPLELVPHLRVLQISRASKLRRLPDNLGTLVPELQQLHLKGAESLEALPETVTQLVHLTSLLIEDAGLVELPEGLSAIPRLRELCLRNCTALTRLPCSLSGLSSLQKLYVSRTPISTLPPNFGQLARLRELDVRGCQQLKALPEDFPMLEMLKLLMIEGCKALGPIPEQVRTMPGLQIVVDTNTWIVRKIRERRQFSEYQVML